MYWVPNRVFGVKMRWHTTPHGNNIKNVSPFCCVCAMPHGGMLSQCLSLSPGLQPHLCRGSRLWSPAPCRWAEVCPAPPLWKWPCTPSSSSSSQVSHIIRVGNRVQHSILSPAKVKNILLAKELFQYAAMNSTFQMVKCIRHWLFADVTLDHV